MAGQVESIRELASIKPVFTAADVQAVGATKAALGRLVTRGEVMRMARGVYMLASADVSPHHSLLETQLRVPRGVISLLSALAYHELSDEMPHEVWVAHARSQARPSVPELPIKFVAMSLNSFEFGVEVHTIQGVDLKVTSPAKTIADCFKFRSAVGIEACVSALRDFKHRRVGSPNELMEAARVCRVAEVMRPYLEALW